MTTDNSVLVKPHITEKAAVMSDKGVYVFQVTPKSTKPEIKKAIESVYKVTVTDINIANKKGKSTFVRGQRGKRNDVKKAYVTLKKGDSISLI